TNSLVVAATNGWGFTSVATNSTALFTNDPGNIFQTVGAASHYLVANSPYRDAGTTNISSALLAQLRKKTTFPPIVHSGTSLASTDITLSPQAQRDTDT